MVHVKEKEKSGKGLEVTVWGVIGLQERKSSPRGLPENAGDLQGGGG